MADLLVLTRPAEWRRLQRSNLNILGQRKKKSGLNATKRAVGKYARAAFAKRKRNRAICPDSEGGESQVSESRTLAKGREGDQSRSMEKGELHCEGRQVPRR